VRRRPIRQRAPAGVDHLAAAVHEHDVGMRVEHGDLLAERPGQVLVVGVEPGDVAPARERQAGVARGRDAAGTARAPVAHARVGEAGDDGAGRVARGVVYDDHLEPRDVLGQRARDRGADVARGVARRDADADADRRAHAGTRLRNRLFGVSSS
jgi:hypothetical protein